MPNATSTESTIMIHNTRPRFSRAGSDALGIQLWCLHCGHTATIPPSEPMSYELFLCATCASNEMRITEADPTTYGDPPVQCC